MTLITKKIETLYAVAGIGTVIVFWYNFKKNEKDSDIEFIKYF